MTEPGVKGRTIAHYRLLEEVGRGAQGRVYLAEDVRLGRKVALKVLSTPLTTAETTIRRFRREAEAASRLDHAGICSVYEAGEADGALFIAMRYVEGESLAKLILSSKTPTPLGTSGSETVVLPASSSITEQPPVVRPEPPRSRGGSTSALKSRADIIRTVQLIEKAARALHAAHEAGLIHRDIKPGNIMVARDGEPVILDFGLARDEEGEVQSVTHSGDLLGTPAYMSPEQLLAQRITLDRRTDVYSLGITLYECLTLRRPFDAPTREALYQQILTAPVPDPTRFNRHIPRDLKVVLETAMERDRNRRYKTALELAEDLRRVRSYEPIHARPAGPVLRFVRWTQRNPVIATATLGLFLILSTALGISLVLLGRIQRETTEKQTALVHLGKESALKEEALRAVEGERDAKARALLDREKALGEAEGLRLTAQASSAAQTNPGLALLLAIEAADRAPGAVLNNVLVETLKAHREERVFSDPAGSMASVFSPDGRLVLISPHSRPVARVRDVTTAKLVAVIGGFEEPILDAVFSPDSSRLVTVHNMSAVARLWDARSGKLLAPLEGHKDRLTTAAFSRDGERIATAGVDGSVRTWSGRTGAAERLFKCPASGVGAAFLGPDGSRLFTASDGMVHTTFRNPDGSVQGYSTTSVNFPTMAQIWDAATGEEIHRLRGHQGPVTLAVSPDGRLVFTGSQRRSRMRVWDAASGAEVCRMDAPWGSTTAAAEFSPDSARLVTVSQGFSGAARASPTLGIATVIVWDAATGREITGLRGHEGLVRDAHFSPDGERLITASSDSTARVWSARSGEALHVLRGHIAEVQTAAFSPDGKKAFTRSADGTARVWNVDPRQRFAAVSFDPGDEPSVFVLSPDGSSLFGARVEGGGAVRDAVTGAPVCQIGRRAGGDRGLLSRLGLAAAPARGGSPFETVWFSPSGKRLVTLAGLDVQAWDAGSGRLLWTWTTRGTTPSTMTPRVAVSSDGAQVAISQASKGVTGIEAYLTGARSWQYGPFRYEVVIVDAETGKETSTLPEHESPIISLELSPRGGRLLTFTEARNLRVWEARSGKLLRHLRQIRQGARLAVLSPDGSRICVADWGMNARLFDATSGVEVGTLPGHEGQVTAMAFSPDGRRIATASADYTARLWDAASGDALFTLNGHTGSLFAVAFSPDGSKLLTASADQTVRVWNAASGAEVVTLRHDEGVRSAQFAADGGRILSVSGRGAPFIWPLDLVAEARRRRTRDLSPNEMERLGVGTPAERKAVKARRQVDEILETLSFAGTQANGVPPRDSVISALGALADLVAHDTPETAVNQILEAMERLGPGLQPPDPVVLGKLGTVRGRAGRLAEALATIEEATSLTGDEASYGESLRELRRALLPDIPTYHSLDAALLAGVELVPRDARWRFFRGRTEPSDGLAWTLPEFDDSGWEEGPSGFGFGDNDDATVVADMAGRYTTLYIRHAFDVAEPAHWGRIELSVIADDGFVAYLNGEEVGRDRAGASGTRLPSAAVASALATEPVQAVDVVLGGALRKGRNILAIQGLNQSLTSTDFSLIPSLAAEPRPGVDGDLSRFAPFFALARERGGATAARARYLEGRLLERAGGAAEARTRFEEAIAADALRAEPRVALARSHLQGGDALRAEALLREGISAGARPEAPLWDLWFQATFVELRRPLAAALDAFPAVSSPEPGGRGEDVRWLLEGLRSQGAARIRCGGDDYLGVDGRRWGRDRFFVGGTPYSPGAFRGAIAGTDDDPLYQTERWFRTSTRLFGYRLPLPPARYRVTLHFAEIRPYISPRRRFSILLEGKTVLENYEPASAGLATADSRAFEVEARDGFLDLELLPVEQNPKVSAIEVETVR